MKRYTPLLLGAVVALLSASQASLAQSPLKLYVFDCGRIQFDSVAAFGIQDDETDVRELIVPCYVIEHEKGRLLWNAGLPPALAETEGWQEQDGARARLDRTLPEQLADMDLGMDDFDYAAFSHMHFDHVGAANELEGAIVIMQKAEHDAAFADSVTVPGFDPTAYDGLRDEEVLIIEGDHDVFGDGSVRIISTPGHTPGHQSLFVALPQTGPIVLSGDLYHFRLNRELRRVPTFNVDPDATLASMDRLESLVEETGAELWIEHELARFEELKKAPEFYE
ncbi:MAG: N-acyl homoserine lactonase family protein [Gemmatimonadota bacterium]